MVTEEDYYVDPFMEKQKKKKGGGRHISIYSPCIAGSLTCVLTAPSSSCTISTVHKLVLTASLPAKFRNKAAACLQTEASCACICKCFSAWVSPPPAQT